MKIITTDLCIKFKDSGREKWPTRPSIYFDKQRAYLTEISHSNDDEMSDLQLQNLRTKAGLIQQLTNDTNSGVFFLKCL